MKLKSKKSGAIIGTETYVNLPSFERPKWADNLRFPDDITQLNAQNVSELIGKYTALLCYVQEQYSRLCVKLVSVESQAQQLESRIYLDTPQIAHLERWRRDQKINADSRMLGLKIRETEVRKHKEVTWSFVQNYERCISALSRELTRKTSDGKKSAVY